MTMRLIIEGWRFVPHSYAVVNQFLAMELLDRPDVELYCRDVPFVFPSVKINPQMPGDEEIANRLRLVPTAGPSHTADATLRLFIPLNLAPAASGRTLVFTTAEFGCLDAAQIGASSIAALNILPNLALLTPSRWSASGLIRGGADPDKVVVIPHGFDPALFRPPTHSERASLRRERDWDDKFIFLNVGALTANKGIFELLKAFALLTEDFPAARLVLKGLDSVYPSARSLDEYKNALSPQERERIEPRLIYIGQDLTFAQTAALYQAADAYVTPYHAEGFNLPALEAAACGLPVICTGGGPTDDFTNDTFALRIDSRSRRAKVDQIPAAQELAPNPASLIQHMRHVLQDADWVASARLAGPDFVRSRFTWKHVADQLFSVLADPHATAWQAQLIPRPHSAPRRPTADSTDLQDRAWSAYRAGDRPAAQELCRKVLHLDPLQPDMIYLLGVIALDAGSPHDALLHFHHAVTLRPDAAPFHAALGEACNSVRQFDDAIESLRAAIHLDPSLATAHNALGRILLDKGDIDRAADCFRAALAARPNYDRAHLNLGRAFHLRGELPSARASFEEALRFNPNYAIAHNNLGGVLQAEGQIPQAITHFRHAIRLQADYPEAHFNLGAAMLAQGDPQVAATSFQEAIRLRPTYARAHAMLGQALVDLGQVAASVAILKTAIRLKPDDIDSHKRLGDVLRLLGQSEESMAVFDQAVRIAPSDPSIFAHRFRMKAEICDWRDQPAELDRLWTDAQRAIDANQPAPLHPMFALSLPWSPERQLALAQNYANQFNRFSTDSSPATPPPPQNGRIKIGYLSRDFYDHPVAHQLHTLFAHHDRKKFEIHAYSFGPDDKSLYRENIIRGCEHFHNVETLSLTELDRQIRADGIHILVDLMGYSGLARTACFALRPAPIQASWLGYAGTMGAGFIDYLIGDPVATPPAHAANFTEAIVRLPHSYFPATHEQEISPPTSGAQSNLPNDAIVFCCFNNAHKIDPQTFAIWMRILSRLPGAVAWFSVRDPLAQSNLRREAKARNIDPGRLIFSAHVKSKADHLARLRLADIFLDTTYYNAHATACDALSAGVPLLTCPGQTFASRVGASLLTAVGLPELICDDLQQYEARAIELATDTAARLHLREKLDEARTSSPLFDTPRFVRNLERAFARMWDNHVTSRQPQAIDVTE